jgi:DnaK suppressor protein
MTKPNININIIMTALKAKEADASRILQSRDAIIIEKSADELDEIEGAVAREIAIRHLDRESGLLREIRSALRRIDAGTFGMCLH